MLPGSVGRSPRNHGAIDPRLGTLREELEQCIAFHQLPEAIDRAIRDAISALPQDLAARIRILLEGVPLVRDRDARGLPPRPNVDDVADEIMKAPNRDASIAFTEALVTRFGADSAFGRELRQQLFPRTWSGSLADLLRSRADAARGWAANTNKNEELREWARISAEWLENVAKNAQSDDD